MMSFGKNVQRNLMENQGTSGTIVRKIESGTGFNDSLYRLIEKDEGVPFHLVFGDEPGKGTYLFVGEGIRKLTGFDAHSFTEKNMLDIIEEIVPLSESIPADPVIIRKMILRGELREYKLEMRIRSRNGERKWIRETAVQCSEANSVTGLIGIYHDITEKKNHNILLEEAIEKASESERLKDAFLQNISHEVRTPLNAIVGFSTLLSEPGLDYGKKEEFTRMINTSTDDLLNIMDNIIEISRLEAGSETLTVSEVKPAEIMRRILNAFQDKVRESRVSLVCSIPGNLSGISVRTDGYKLFQIIYNLTSNALKFTPEGRIEFGYKLTAEHIEFYVSDTGIGISEQDKSKIFNKFFQAESGSKRRFPGVGLGLTISKAYAGLLGGSLNFQSECGTGSTFRFILPY